MVKEFIPSISVEKMAAYLDGNLEEMEMMEIENIISESPTLQNQNYLFSQIDCDINSNLYQHPNELNLMEVLPCIPQIHDNISINTINSFNMESKNVIGEITPFPEATSADTLQNTDYSCAVKSQQIIMTEFGQDVTEESLLNEAIEKEYCFEEIGTPFEKMGCLLTDHGIPNHTKSNANVYDLVNELAQGHKVMVGVDANELWYDSVWQDVKDCLWETPNHALVVTGIDNTDPQNVKVIITDPGTGDVAKEYPLDQFMDAWKDANCTMVATDEAPENIPNFDYETGHLPMVGNYTFEDFQSYILPPMDDFFSQLTTFNTLDMQNMPLWDDACEHAYDIYCAPLDDLSSFEDSLFDFDFNF